MNVRERAALSEALEIAAVEICKTVIGPECVKTLNRVFYSDARRPCSVFAN